MHPLIHLNTKIHYMIMVNPIITILVEFKIISSITNIFRTDIYIYIYIYNGPPSPPPLQYDQKSIVQSFNNSGRISLDFIRILVPDVCNAFSPNLLISEEVLTLPKLIHEHPTSSLNSSFVGISLLKCNKAIVY